MLSGGHAPAQLEHSCSFGFKRGGGGGGGAGGRIICECRVHAGTLTQEGQIACECKQCRPGGAVKTPSVSCSEFEEHAGSRERRPAESIYLECIAISLKVLHAALLPASSGGPAYQPSHPSSSEALPSTDHAYV